MPARIVWSVMVVLVFLPLLKAAICSAAEKEPAKVETKEPEFLGREPLKEDRPDIDAKELAERNRLRRARYNIALQDLKARCQLFVGGRADLVAVLNAQHRFQSADASLPGRPLTGEAMIADEEARLAKRLEFMKWLEGIVQNKHEEGTAPIQELLEVQYHRLNVEVQLADMRIGQPAK
jgi:hypothetical protein